MRAPFAAVDASEGECVKGPSGPFLQSGTPRVIRTPPFFQLVGSNFTVNDVNGGPALVLTRGRAFREASSLAGRRDFFVKALHWIELKVFVFQIT